MSPEQNNKKKFKVSLNFVGSCSYEIEAESFEEAVEKAFNQASLSDGEAYEWDDRNPGEVRCGDESKPITEIP